jgi:8-oxo-dGTP diphosphatase
MSGDGNGWAYCGQGHQHWGRFGAAGVLITDGRRVMLQRRAGWTHEGGTWAVPGGARDSHEDAVMAALREATEETTLDWAALTPGTEWIDDHGGWSYTTIIARADPDLELAPASPESDELQWWPIEAVAGLPLHYGFAASWPRLRALILTTR